jgi:hypothetical protein
MWQERAHTERMSLKEWGKEYNTKFTEQTWENEDNKPTKSSE